MAAAVVYNDDGSATCGGYTVKAGPGQSTLIAQIQGGKPGIGYNVTAYNDGIPGICRDYPAYAASVGYACR